MRPPPRPPWWLVALLVLVAFAFQGSRAIWEPDEGRYTGASLNMLQSGDWLLPTVDGEHPHGAHGHGRRSLRHPRDGGTPSDN